MLEFRNPRHWKENDKKQSLSCPVPMGLNFYFSVLNALPLEEKNAITRKSNNAYILSMALQ